MKIKIAMIGLLLTVHLLSACAFFAPHANQYKATKFSCSPSGDSADWLDDANHLADYLRCKYTSALNQRTGFNRGAGVAVASALGLAGYNAITGGSSAQLVALTVGSATLYGASSILSNDAVASSYIAGIDAISCLVERSGSSFRAVKTIKSELVLKKGLVNELNTCAAGKKTAEGQIRRLEIRVESVNDGLVYSINAVDAQVKAAVESKLPDLNQIMSIANQVRFSESIFDRQGPLNTSNVPNSCNTSKQNSILKEIDNWAVEKSALLISAVTEGGYAGCWQDPSKEMSIGMGNTQFLDMKKGDTKDVPIYHSSGPLAITLSHGEAISVVENLKITPHGLTVSALPAAAPNVYYAWVHDIEQNVTATLIINIRAD